MIFASLFQEDWLLAAKNTRFTTLLWGGVFQDHHHYKKLTLELSSGPAFLLCKSSLRANFCLELAHCACPITFLLDTLFHLTSAKNQARAAEPWNCRSLAGGIGPKTVPWDCLATCRLQKRQFGAGGAPHCPPLPPFQVLAMHLSCSISAGVKGRAASMATFSSGDSSAAEPLVSRPFPKS